VLVAFTFPKENAEQWAANKRQSLEHFRNVAFSVVWCSMLQERSLKVLPWPAASCESGTFEYGKRWREGPCRHLWHPSKLRKVQMLQNLQKEVETVKLCLYVEKSTCRATLLSQLFSFYPEVFSEQHTLAVLTLLYTKYEKNLENFLNKNSWNHSTCVDAYQANRWSFSVCLNQYKNVAKNHFCLLSEWLGLSGSSVHWYL